ncbi:hypothetical protein WG66_014610 [Moniliophthora roreri]|nr:hypothetical protein WG66_014610 [Moniliophthora roreri]
MYISSIPDLPLGTPVALPRLWKTIPSLETIRRLFASVDAKIAQCIDYTLHLIHNLPGTSPVLWDGDQSFSMTDIRSVSDSKDITPPFDHAARTSLMRQ